VAAAPVGAAALGLGEALALWLGDEPALALGETSALRVGEALALRVGAKLAIAFLAVPPQPAARPTVARIAAVRTRFSVNRRMPDPSALMAQVL
jgi:hypothetical protein